MIIQLSVSGHPVLVKDEASMEGDNPGYSTHSPHPVRNGGGGARGKVAEGEDHSLGNKSNIIGQAGVAPPPGHFHHLSSPHLPLCLTTKDLPPSLPVYCGACTQHSVIISQDALQPGIITSCTMPMAMPPMNINEPVMMTSVMGHPSVPLPPLADLPTVKSMKLSPLDKEPTSPPDGTEWECRWMQCERRFSALDDLVNHVNDQHVKVERPDIDYQCKWTGCPRQGKGFNARYKMLIHIRTHTNEKPHRCGLCGKCFSRLENLKIHNRSHTGEKPYVCPVQGCHKAYSNSSDRFKHVRTHQEEKPYVCKMPGCHKRYTDPSSLRKHVRTIGHYFRGDGSVTPKLRHSSPPSPVPTPPITVNNLINLTPSNELLGNLPSHFLPLSSNIFPVSSLHSLFSPPVVTSSHASPSISLPANHAGIIISDSRSIRSEKTDSPIDIKTTLPSPRCQDGPLDLSRSPLPHPAKEDETAHFTDYVQVD
ncbi:zinc finger protein GLIS2-like isoform X3 [Haliotis rufescens]|uniref:zinc finger protein GLIS2-like isoform X2 n=1 Tax=Haliotis rufescens TaxID=6454 RepID=UPI001EAF91AA|nr:zinc finger protein GLIS2-like isoform X2 [Haliotis rufescens]XP_046334720.1 zinc finger protein GLIS2-like isoform X2 [Haliotis rufescens]XP_046334721.1 zinc finger protein GLIS2-like isoform X3 [Haliotis rufescens]